MSLTTNQLGDNHSITLELSAFEGEGELGDVILPGSQPTQAALVTGGLHQPNISNISDLEFQDSLSESERGTVGSLNIQVQGGVHSAPFQQQQEGAAIIVSLVGLPLALSGHSNPQIPLPEHNAGMLGYLAALILGSNQTNLIWRLILITALNFVAAAVIGVVFLPRNLEGVHTTYWRVMLIMTVGVPIVVAVITLLFSFWLASDPEGWSNWVTGLSVANVSMLAGPLIVYWVLGATGN